MRSPPAVTMFVDMNAFFASVEQQDDPSLRGRPVGVVPIAAASSCCIAASYEARALGVRTGTIAAEARRLCPGIVLRQARVSRYVRVHHALRAAIDAVVPVEAACSIDEFRCRLTGWQAEPGEALSLARRVRERIRTEVGEALRSSIGLAPNGMLAKLASGLRKPNGLTVIGRDELPRVLHSLSLTDFPGISGRMEARLHRHGIRDVASLCVAPRAQLRAVWGGVVGEDWWHWLRGEEAGRTAGQRRSFGNQHVLAPALRTPEGSRAVAVRLLHKAAARLRAHGSLARRLDLHVDPIDGPPRGGTRRFTPTAETGDLLHWLLSIWDSAAGMPARRIGVVLGDLVAAEQAGEPLFEPERARGRLGAAMDRINQRLGHAAVYYGSMHAAKDAAPRRIAFGSIPDLSLVDTEIEGDTAPRPMEAPWLGQAGESPRILR